MELIELRALVIGAHVSLAGFLYGLDTGSIGPITEMQQFRDSIAPLSADQQGIYVASILLASSLSSLLSGHVADAISRRYGILASAIISLIGTVISATAPNFAALIVARIITGFGLGQAFAVTTVYLVEIAPKNIRGVAACMLQTYVVLGVTVGYFVCFASQNLPGTIAWRTPFILQSCVSVILAVGMLFLPFSPRWLCQKGRFDEARHVLTKMRRWNAVESEMEEIQAGISTHQNVDETKWVEMFNRRYIGRTMLGLFLMSFQQLTGIDVVLYYAPIVFSQAGFSSARASFLASGVSGIVMLAATIPAQIWIDRWGRRMPLIIGGAAMAACFIVNGAMYASFGERVKGGVQMESKAAQWVVVVMIYVFVANFSWSWAVVGKVYSVEIVPTRLRAKVSAVEQLANWMTNFAVTLIAPIFLRASPSGPYFLFGIATLFAAAVCYRIPETKGRSLEVISNEFEEKSLWKRLTFRNPERATSTIETPGLGLTPTGEPQPAAQEK